MWVVEDERCVCSHHTLMLSLTVESDPSASSKERQQNEEEEEDLLDGRCDG